MTGPLPPLARDAHKGDAGRLFVLAGTREMPGAASLVARAAQRAGAGRVTLGALDEELLLVVPGSSPETVLLALPGPDREHPDADLPGVPSEPGFHARVVGPGLGANERTLALVRHTLAGGFEGPQVLDADALNVVAPHLEWTRRATGPLVVTPHGGEAARLLGGERVATDVDGRIDAARRIALAVGGICVLKGAGSVVTDGERVHVNTTGNPGMATAGSGDVLSGILGAYLAAASRADGFDPFATVRAAVHVHGRAGDLAAAELGERAVVAGDLVRFLPAAQRELEEPDA